MFASKLSLKADGVRMMHKMLFALIVVSIIARCQRVADFIALLATRTFLVLLAQSLKTRRLLFASGLWQCTLSHHTRREFPLISWQEILRWHKRLLGICFRRFVLSLLKMIRLHLKEKLSVMRCILVARRSGSIGQCVHLIHKVVQQRQKLLCSVWWKFRD